MLKILVWSLSLSLSLSLTHTLSFSQSQILCLFGWIECTALVRSSTSATANLEALGELTAKTVATTPGTLEWCARSATTQSPFVWLMELREMKAVWRLTWTDAGAPFVIFTGTHQMLLLSADSWDMMVSKAENLLYNIISIALLFSYSCHVNVLYYW